MNYTHIFHETGNGFPTVGDEVLVEGVCGWHTIMQVVEISSVHTRQWAPNYVYLSLDAADRDYDELDDDDAREAWESLHHVSVMDSVYNSPFVREQAD